MNARMRVGEIDLTQIRFGIFFSFSIPIYPPAARSIHVFRRVHDPLSRRIPAE